MPIELADYLTIEQYNYLMGLAGITSAFVVLYIWGQGL